MIRIKSNLKFISTEEGGRRTPLFNITKETPYRPNFVFGFSGSLFNLKKDSSYIFDDSSWIEGNKSIDGSIFPDVDKVLPGSSISAEVIIRNTDYINEFLNTGATFLVREGSRVVATGEILEVLEWPSEKSIN